MNSGTPFSSAFHLFVCAASALLSKSLLLEKDFQGLMLKLQNLPTFHWSENEVKLLVADAYHLKYAILAQPSQKFSYRSINMNRQ